MASNEKLLNYKVVDLVKIYNFHEIVNLHSSSYKLVMIFIKKMRCPEIRNSVGSSGYMFCYSNLPPIR